MPKSAVEVVWQDAGVVEVVWQDAGVVCLK